MEQTITLKVGGINRSVYFAAETLHKIESLGGSDNLSGFIKELVDAKFDSQSIPPAHPVAAITTKAKRTAKPTIATPRAA